MRIYIYFATLPLKSCLASWGPFKLRTQMVFEFGPHSNYYLPFPAADEDNLLEPEPEPKPNPSHSIASEAGPSSTAQKRRLDEDAEVETESQTKRTRVDQSVNKVEARVSEEIDVTSGDEQNLEVEISVPDQTEQTTGGKPISLK